MRHRDALRLAALRRFDSVGAIEHVDDPTSAAALLNVAAANGYFRRESLKGPGAARLVSYWPLAKALPADRDARTSYFTGLKRVRSVFELGASL